jgi:hypothetical protein
MKLCQLTTSFDSSDHLPHPLFRPLVLPSKYDRQWLSPPQKVMLPTLMTRFAGSRSRFLKISNCNVRSDDQRLYRFPDRPAHWQSKRVWMEQPEAGVQLDKIPPWLQFLESAVRGDTSTSRITFRNRYFILSSLPPSSSPIGTDRKASQKLISLITSTPLSVVKFEFFEDVS